MSETPPVVLTIAGFDPCSGAGITADIKTIAAHGCYGVACITALTVQSTAGVRRVETVDSSLISETLEEIYSDLPIAAVHIGMLGSAQIVQTIINFLYRVKPKTVVLDPILKSSSGADLLNEEGAKLLVQKMLPMVDVVTPNTSEAAVLSGCEVATPEQMKQAARTLQELGAKAVVVTGGDLEKAIDLLSFTTGRGIEQEVFKSERQKSKSTHGTGCAFATAIACHLAMGRGLPEAVLLAKAYVTAAIVHGQPLGRGTGPLHHLYRMTQTQPQRRVVYAEQEGVH